MSHCRCHERHPSRRVVITGGPGAGKTALLELARRSLCTHIHRLPEVATLIFSGGFPRKPAPEFRRAAQRAIFHVQHEIEDAYASEDAALTLCDRGSVDGVAYWVGDGELLASVGTTLEAELARYAVVIHLRTPNANHGYNHVNPLRTESAEEAAAIDERIQVAWAKHPRRHIIDATDDFMTKASRVIEILRAELPACCQGHVKAHAQ